MFRIASFRKIFRKSPFDIDQVKLLYFLSLLVGLLSALAAAFLKNTIHYTHILLTKGITSESGNYLYLAYPLAGMLLTLLFVRYFVNDNISHGISRVLYAISKRKGYLRTHNTWSSIVASTLTIGFGGSVGAEAPVVLTGSSIGSTVGRFFRMNNKSITLLIGCGAAGAIAGIFKAPIAGIVFVLEVLMLDLTISSIVPLLISSVTAATVAYFLMGDKVLFAFNVAEAFNISNIHWYIVLGIISGLISLYFSKMTLFLESNYEKVKNQYVRLAVGGTILGILIYIFPPFYGEGYDTIMTLLQGNSGDILTGRLFGHVSDSFVLFAVFMAGLVLLKVVASSSTNGAGGVGGIFAPTLFIGGINGFFIASLLRKLFQVDLPDNRFVLAGMAGMMAGVMHAPLTAIFLIAEITGGYDLLIPLIITSTIAYITTRSFEKHSIYHVQLASRGELITHDKDKAVLTRMNWKKEIETDLKTTKPDDTLGDLIKIISISKRNIFPVVDQYNILEGVVSLDDVREIMFQQELYKTIYVKDIMTIPPTYIDIKENIETVMEAFRKTGAWNLPVLDNGYYIGFISKSRIYSTYRELLLEYSEE
ncbi:MAG: chloride channel protein [Bacteroidetes bacterium GWA2_40_15]|nr:MAG: chloride channel protein [Bacteroidetes bacterium GWA2_40_15]OFX94836.1 MAG: chloride channel protein [Bacteroidetes bacterium GWC2_40_22]HBH85063.1 chloride channel protein [Bacteroidales bacterium]HBQ82391.1 chloride channel protein [Bacteroidales bacterium]HCU18287.1 chloride channel protein [Bacteroidales bacterium]